MPELSGNTPEANGWVKGVSGDTVYLARAVRNTKVANTLESISLGYVSVSCQQSILQEVLLSRPRLSTVAGVWGEQEMIVWQDLEQIQQMLAKSTSMSCQGSDIKALRIQEDMSGLLMMKKVDSLWSVKIRAHMHKFSWSVPQKNKHVLGRFLYC